MRAVKSNTRKKSKDRVKRRWVCLYERIKHIEIAQVVELGVWAGKMSKALLETAPNIEMLYLVDTWEAPKPGSTYFQGSRKISRYPQSKFDQAFKETKERIAPWIRKCVIMKMESAEAAEQIEDNILDCVFVDGDHSYEGTSRDIKLWLPKVKEGSWIGGHDYGNTNTYGNVKQAVDEAFGRKVELDGNHTWWVKL